MLDWIFRKWSDMYIKISLFFSSQIENWKVFFVIGDSVELSLRLIPVGSQLHASQGVRPNSSCSGEKKWFGRHLSQNWPSRFPSQSKHSPPWPEVVYISSLNRHLEDHPLHSQAVKIKVNFFKFAVWAKIL